MPHARDELWETIQQEVADQVQAEPMLASFFHSVVLNHQSLADALSFRLAGQLAGPTLPALSLRDLFDEAYAGDPAIIGKVRNDIRAVCQRDPACDAYSIPLLYFKGFLALQAHRLGHYFWAHEREHLALFLQSRISEVFAVDIHPAARIGSGLLIDHATGLVIGETAVVEDDVSLLHEVTLGGTGKQTGDRHPKVRKGVLIGAGAKLLGNIEIGQGAKIGAGSVVLESVPPHSTAVGVPAKVVGHAEADQPALEMDHRLGPN
ncbi:MAG: serine O-acetyltransferase [Phycisphaerae bacterium]